VKLIFELLGTPSEAYIQSFPDDLRKVMKETGPKNGIPLETLFKSATKDGFFL
jgi:mitogen-activated protein kinase 1/3